MTSTRLKFSLFWELAVFDHTTLQRNCTEALMLLHVFNVHDCVISGRNVKGQRYEWSSLNASCFIRSPNKGILSRVANRNVYFVVC